MHMSPTRGSQYHEIRLIATNPYGTTKTDWVKARGAGEPTYGDASFAAGHAVTAAENPPQASFYPLRKAAEHGGTVSFYLHPDAGYTITSDITSITLGGCPAGTWESVGSGVYRYTTGPITTRCTLTWPTATDLNSFIDVAIDEERTVHYNGLSAHFDWSASIDAGNAPSITYEDPKDDSAAPHETTLEYEDSHTLSMTSTAAGVTTLSTTPDGKSTPSTITAHSIDNLAITTNDDGEATLNGSAGGSDFNITTDSAGNSVITHTNAEGKVTTLELPYPNEIVIAEDGTITATHGDRTVTLNNDGTTSYTDKLGNPQTQAAGERLTVTADDVLVDKTYTVIYKPNNGEADTIRQLAYASNPQESVPAVARENFTFSHWSPDTAYLTADLNLTAHWSPQPGTIDRADYEPPADEAGCNNTANIDYVTTAGTNQNTTLEYCRGAGVSVSGGDGDDLGTQL